MGYGFGFLLSVVKLPKVDDVEVYVEEIATKYKMMAKNNEWFPDIGVKCYAGATSYACGGQKEKLEEVMINFAKEFPEVTFALYWCYYDYRCIKVLTFSKKGIMEEAEILMENKIIGNYKIHLACNFKNIIIPNNITKYINENYYYEFEYQGNLLKY